ncbi:MAG: IS30 family transposase [Myxococcales bacterium]|nr:IS30 family transposase [Myxococcales bacterium]
MATRHYRYWTSSERAELWKRWHRGESLGEIARGLGRAAGSVQRYFSHCGGIEPRRRTRRASALTLEEREEISRGLANGYSCRRIAKELGRDPSTVSREVARNGGRRAYRATRADARALKAALRPKPRKLATDPKLRRLVAKKLRNRWSPRQISGWLKARSSCTSRMYVSHETIYRTLFVQARGALEKELVAHLRSRRTMRRSRNWSERGKGKGQIPNAISIRERPADAEDRAVPGHWEGDLLMGTAKTQIATLVERSSRFTILVQMPSRDPVKVAEALCKQITKLPAHLRRSLTWDRGLEMTRHADFSIATGVQVYFCDPRSPWQRGTNENTNRLLRQYFPKGQPIDGYSQRQLDAVARELNERPRQTLNFKSPAEILSSALTG